MHSRYEVSDSIKAGLNNGLCNIDIELLNCSFSNWRFNQGLVKFGVESLLSSSIIVVLPPHLPPFGVGVFFVLVACVVDVLLCHHGCRGCVKLCGGGAGRVWQLLPWRLNVVVVRHWCQCWHRRRLRLPCIGDPWRSGAAASILTLLTMLTAATDIIDFVVVISVFLSSSPWPLQLQCRRRQVSRCTATSRWEEERLFALFLFCWLLRSCSCCCFCCQRPLSCFSSGWLSHRLSSRRDSSRPPRKRNILRVFRMSNL